VSQTTEVRLKFQGEVREMALWVALSVLMGWLIVPLAWIHAGMARWVCRRVEFSDGTRAEFRGTAGEVVVWHVFLLVVLVGQRLLLGQEDRTGVLAPVLLTTALAGLAIALTLIRWLVHNLRLEPGPPLTFTGSFLGFAGWHALLVAALPTVVGWAWVATAMCRWMARQVRGQGVAVEFRGAGFEFLWRSLAAALGSVPVVTAPWMALWWWRWLLEQVVLVRGVETPFEDWMPQRRGAAPRA
jgi:hypothetical protein